MIFVLWHVCTFSEKSPGITKTLIYACGPYGPTSAKPSWLFVSRSDAKDMNEVSLTKLFGISLLVILLSFFHEIAISRQLEKSFGALNRIVLLSKQRKVFQRKDVMASQRSTDCLMLKYIALFR